MKVCIIGDNLVGLTVAKALVNRDINVDIIHKKAKQKSNQHYWYFKVELEYNKNIINIDKFPEYYKN